MRLIHWAIPSASHDGVMPRISFFYGIAITNRLTSMSNAPSTTR
jgi:hypothetical protein